jgi:hypothetical protein
VCLCFCEIDSVSVPVSVGFITKEWHHRVFKTGRSRELTLTWMNCCFLFLGCFFFSQMPGSSMPCFRGQALVHASPIVILELLWDTSRFSSYCEVGENCWIHLFCFVCFDRKSLYDELFKSSEILLTIDEQTQVEHHIVSQSLSLSFCCSVHIRT